jgi:hypothetical protein
VDSRARVGAERLDPAQGCQEVGSGCLPVAQASPLPTRRRRRVLLQVTLTQALVPSPPIQHCPTKTRSGRRWAKFHGPHARDVWCGRCRRRADARSRCRVARRTVRPGVGRASSAVREQRRLPIPATPSITANRPRRHRRRLSRRPERRPRGLAQVIRRVSLTRTTPRRCPRLPRKGGRLAAVGRDAERGSSARELLHRCPTAPSWCRPGVLRHGGPRHLPATVSLPRAYASRRTDAPGRWMAFALRPPAPAAVTPRSDAASAVVRRPCGTSGLPRERASRSLIPGLSGWTEAVAQTGPQTGASISRGTTLVETAQEASTVGTTPTRWPRNSACSSHRCPRNLISRICATASTSRRRLEACGRRLRKSRKAQLRARGAGVLSLAGECSSVLVHEA